MGKRSADQNGRPDTLESAELSESAKGRGHKDKDLLDQAPPVRLGLMPVDNVWSLMS
jgi:hypothetical protein